MNWPFSKKNKKPTSAADGATPFFNVMPKEVVQSGGFGASFFGGHHETLAPAKPAAATTFGSAAPAVVPPAIHSSTTSEIAQAKRTQKIPNASPKTWQILGGVVAIVFAFGAVWYAYVTFGGSTDVFDGIQKLWRRVPPIVEKKPNTTAAAPTGTLLESAGVSQISTDWLLEHFEATDCADCSDLADPDADGATNLQEFQAKTNPKQSDTDTDGLADGDELQVFLCDPTNARTARNQQFTDADYMRGGWDCVFNSTGDVKLSDDRKKQITEKIAQFGLHEPSKTSLGEPLTQFVVGAAPTPTSATPELPSFVDISADAQLERDMQRLTTIKNVAAALLQYKKELGAYPQVSNFAEMAQKVKPFLQVATNVVDPVNVRPMVYGYQLDQNGTAFLLTYYAETQKQIARYTESKARMDTADEGAENRDVQRSEDLDKIRAALLIYSAANSEANESFVFPLASVYESKIAPQYIPTVPRDPLTGKAYPYEVSGDGATFTLKAVYEKPAAGMTGYLCNQEECRNY